MENNKFVDIFEEYDANKKTGWEHLIKTDKERYTLPQIVVNTDKGFMIPPPTSGDYTQAPKNSGFVAGSYEELLDKGRELFNKNRSLPFWKDIKAAWLEIWFPGNNRASEKIPLNLI